MKYKYRIVTGDWSEDGHGRMDFFTFECTHSEDEIITGYKEAVKKCGVALHDIGKKDGVSVCVDYEDSKIKSKELNNLRKLGIVFDFQESEIDGKGDNEILYCTSPDLATLFLKMAQTQIPQFEFEFCKKPKCINGFWSKTFNHSIGYGVYY